MRNSDWSFEVLGINREKKAITVLMKMGENLPEIQTIFSGDEGEIDMLNFAQGLLVAQEILETINTR